jgi:hypothetical protein
LLLLSLTTAAQALDLSHDSLAKVHLGDSEPQVLRTLGPPQKTTPHHVSQANGQTQWSLLYPHLTVSLANGKVSSVDATRPSHYATAKGVSIGDSEAKAHQAYGKLYQWDGAHNTILDITTQGGHVVHIQLELEGE